MARRAEGKATIHKNDGTRELAPRTNAESHALARYRGTRSHQVAGKSVVSNACPVLIPVFTYQMCRQVIAIDVEKGDVDHFAEEPSGTDR